MKFSRFTSAIAAVLLGSAVQADTITIDTFDFTEWQNLTAGGIVENFETISGDDDFVGFADVGVTEGELSGPLSTNVGTFQSLGGSGSGSTCANNRTTGCKQVALENDEGINGQGNIVPLDGQWALSSNDTLGIVWTANTGGEFRRLVFGIRDAADQRNISVTIGTDTVWETIDNASSNNNKSYLVVISFSTMVQEAIVRMENSADSPDDAFTIDGVAAVVPLPASALLLLGGIGALGVARRRRRA